MFSLVKLAVLLTAAISVAAVPSHVARQLAHHKDIAARVAQPEVVPVVARQVPAPVKRVRKRAGTGRCSPSNTLSPTVSPTSNSDRKHPGPSNTSTTPQGPQPSTPTPDEPNTPTPSPNEPNTSTPSPDQPNTTTTPDQPNTTPTPDQGPTPTTTSTSDPSPTSGGGNGDVHIGQGTFYSTGLGACGITNNDNQDIAAVSHLFFDSFPGYDGTNSNTNPLCGKLAAVTYQGKSVTVALTDRCEACAYSDLDFSPHAFDQLADPSIGRIDGIQWQIIS